MSWTAEGLLAELRRRGVRLRAEDGRLRLTAPKGSVTPELRAAIEAQKPALLATLTERAMPVLPPLVRVRREGRLPLSFAQERLWFLQQFDPASPVFNLTSANRLLDAVDPAVLERCLAEIVRRHEVLRTTFDAAGGTPAQVIHPPGDFRLPQVDLRGLSEQAAELEARRIASEEAACPFDLERGPLVRFTLLRMPGGGDIGLANIHHAIGDYWSGTVMYKELAALYEAFAAGRPSALAELPFQYADFAEWQREWMQGDALERPLAYWRHQLSGLAPLVLPTDRPRPALQTHRGSIEFVELRADLGPAAASLARSERATTFMLLLAAFYVLLWRRSGQQDVTVGTPIGQRFTSDLEGLIGNFVNNLVLRGDLSGDPTFRQLIGRVRATVLDGVAHQELPFEKLVEALHTQRDLSRSPLFQVLFDFNVEPQSSWHKAERGFALVDRGMVAFDVALHIAESPDRRLRSRWEYNADLFDRGTIQRLAQGYERILGAAVEDPDRRLSRLPHMPEAERRQVAVEWNRTHRPAAPSTVPALLAGAATERPGAVAVTSGEERLTYAELRVRVSALAGRLRRAGVGAETLVGICLERSERMLEAVLAVLEAGGAYLPLDPAFPAMRLAYMVHDSGTGLILTEAGLADRVPAGTRRLLLEAPDGDPQAAPADLLPADVRPENLAYVLYTSGSTGRPKGVAVEHRTVVNFLRAMARREAVRSEDVLLAVTTLSFDISVLELLLPLTVGAQVVVASQETAGDGERLLSEARRVGATVMQATPATWRLVLDALEREPSARLPLRALCGGEALPRDLAARLRDRFSSVTNLYGPTEATVWATAHDLGPATAAISIGRPLDNVRIHILDRDLEPVPIGVPGGLYIGGECLARGYLKRPALTAERFVPDALALAAGGRLYETGDLARWLADGTIELLGRADDQIKIRGFRIELGEIEAALVTHAGIRQVAVAARQDQTGDRRLVAYLVPEREPAPTISELRSFLKERLPDYMLPAASVVLEALPLTANGKIDRRALPEPDAVRPELEAHFEPPRTTIERALAGLWREVLGLDRVGIHDNFFDLGGHSLLMARLHVRLREAIGRDVSLMDMFQYPSIHALTGALAREGQSAVPSFDDARSRAERGRAALRSQHRPRSLTRG